MTYEMKPRSESDEKSPETPRTFLPEEETSCSQLIHEWAAESSCHGIPSIARAENPLRKAFWALVVLSGTAATCYQVSTVIHEYYSYPISVVLEVSFLDDTEFPAVTFCNLNRMRLSQLPLVNGVFEYLLPLSYGNTTRTFKDIAQKLPDIRSEIDQIWTQFGNQMKKDLGHRMEDMLLSCDFAGVPCNISDFDFIWSAMYGNCFTFNFDQGSARRSHMPGPQYGLTLELFIEEAEYIPELTEVPGIRLAVHDQQTMPFPEDDGLLIAPHRHTMLAIQKEVVTRLPPPFKSNCWDLTREQSMPYDVYTEHYDVSYSLKGCQRTCYQHHVMSECDCADPRIPSRGIAFEDVYQARDSNSTMAPCSEDHDTCLVRVKGLYTSGHLACDCHAVCEEMSLGYIVSDSIWPQERYKALAYPLFADRNPGIAAIIDRGGDPASQLIKVQLFYEDLNYDQIRETKAYPVGKVLSDIGGTVGLYLGLSLAALFEFLELFVDLAHLKCHLIFSKCHRKSTTKVKQVTINSNRE